MESKIQVPNNIEDKTVLKRFLTQLVLDISSNPLFSGNVAAQNQALINILQTNPNIDFLNTVAKLNELRTDILTYVEENVETIILQQQEDISVIAEQFGTFYQQALAASWYGLSVKAGGAVAGLEVGSLDPDVTTPGDENSYFRVIADNFIVGRAYEDLTQEEKDYLATNNLPSFGTVYNEDKTPVPALIITWDSVNQTYKHYFNGIVQFSNLIGVPDYALSEDLPINISELTNDVGYTTSTQVNGLLNILEDNLQNQIDGSISTWFNSYVPTLANQPASSWNTNELKNQHLGDLFYDRTTGYAYRFAYEDIDDSPDAGVIYSWIKITDTDVTLALQKAADAQATADGKITTFYQATTPTAEGIGDLWIDSDNNNKLHIWNGSSWDYIRDTSKDVEIVQALQSAANAQETADGKIESFFQSSAPSSGSLGDIWFDTDDGNKVYRYNGTNWVPAQDSKIAQALLDAAEAQSTADGKISTFYTNTTPTAEGIGDLWVNSTTDNTYRWDGTSWILIDAAKAINNGTTTINGGRITTGSITVNEIDANSINLSTLTGYISWDTQIQNRPTSLSSFTNDSSFVTSSYSGFTYINSTGLYTGTVNATQVIASKLSALTTNTGTLNVDIGGYIRGGKNSYSDATPGFWLGYDTDAYKFKFGNSSKFIEWNGTDLILTGDIIQLKDLPPLSINTQCAVVTSSTPITTNCTSTVFSTVTPTSNYFRHTITSDTQFVASKFIKVSGNITVSIQSALNVVYSRVVLKLVDFGSNTITSYGSWIKIDGVLSGSYKSFDIPVSVTGLPTSKLNSIGNDFIQVVVQFKVDTTTSTTVSYKDISGNCYIEQILT